MYGLIFLETHGQQEQKRIADHLVHVALMEGNELNNKPDGINKLNELRMQNNE